MSGEITWVISKGPSLLGLSLGLGKARLRLVDLSQTLSPNENGVNSNKIQGFINYLDNSWVAKASSQAVDRDFIHALMEGRLEIGRMVGMGDRSYPYRRWNGDFPVTEWEWWLWVNSTIVRRSDHVEGLAPQKMQRYVLISCFTHSVLMLVWGWKAVKRDNL